MELLFTVSVVLLIVVVFSLLQEVYILRREVKDLRRKRTVTTIRGGKVQSVRTEFVGR